MEREAFVVPVSFAQQRLWFFDQLEPGTATYNLRAALRLTGTLNVTALEQSFSEIVRRHEALRTTFATVEGQPVQVIAPDLTLSLPVVDLQDLPETQREARAQELATQEAQRPFDLAQGPLLRTTLLKLGQQEHLFPPYHALHRLRRMVYGGTCPGAGAPLCGLFHWQALAPP